MIPHQINLLSQGAFNRFEEQIKKADILFFQNCLNEVVSKQEVFLENVKFLLNVLADDSILIIGDFCNYPSVMELFKQIEVIAEQNLSLTLLRSSNSGNIDIRHNTCLPEIITKKLLTGGNSLIPRKNVSFNYIVVYKPCSEIKANHYYNLGLKKIAEQRHKEAIENFTVALRVNPSFADAYSKRGLAKCELGQELEIIEEFLESKRLEAYYSDFDSYQEVIKEALEASQETLEQYQEALIDFTEAIKFKPNDADNHYKRGMIHYDLGQYQEALIDFTEAIKFKPNDADNHYKRGMIHYDLGQYQEALIDFTEAININPDFSIAYFYRDLALSKLKRSRQAL